MNPMKTSGWLQGLYETSANAREEVGTMQCDLYGNVYRYAKAGSTALAAGKMTVAAGIASAVTNKNAIAAEIGTKVLNLNISSATYAADFFKGGQLQINDADGEGHRYLIMSSSAVSSGTSISVSLGDGIRKALTESSEFTLVHSPFMATAISTTEENEPTGIPLVDVPAEAYYWSQTKGEGICLITGAPAVGSMLTLSSTAGAVKAIDATLDIDQPYIARMMGTAGVAGEYKPVKLCID